MKLAVKEGPIKYTDTSQSVSNFLALRDMFASLESVPHAQILDLGPVWRSNIRFLSQYRCKVFIEDLYRCMRDNPFSAPVKDRNNPVEYLQPYPEKTRFDVILVWDLFDYLNPGQIQGLMEHLVPYCRKGTRLFAVTSTATEIPARPSMFRIIDASALNYEASTTEKIPGPGFNQTSLNKLLKDFRLLRAFRMSSGVEETLFEYTGS